MESDEYDSSNSRRNSLSISALLNDDSVDPVLPSSRPLTPDEKRENRKTWPGFVTEDVPKPKRKRTSTQQFNRLMAVYQQTDTPSSEVREQLAEELDMTKREVQVWFQNRRAKASRARATAVALANSNQSTVALSQYYHPQPIWQETHNTNYLPSSATATATRGSSIYGSHTPPRRASISQSDPSSQLMLNRPPPLSLQPIAPMPPYNNSSNSNNGNINNNNNNDNDNDNNNNNNNNTNVPVPPPTPPFIKPIAPRNHNLQQGFQNLSLHGSVPDQHHVKKRPKSAIDLYGSFDFTRPPP